MAARAHSTGEDLYRIVCDELIEQTRRAGHEALAIATDHPDGELVAINRELAASRSGLPTVLVDADRPYFDPNGS